MALNLESLGLAATVTPDGISAPDYQSILTKLTGYFRQIYGDDAYLDPDSKDGQMVALYASGFHDANNAAIAVYNSFSQRPGKAGRWLVTLKLTALPGRLRRTPLLMWLSLATLARLSALVRCVMRIACFGIYPRM